MTADGLDDGESLHVTARNLAGLWNVTVKLDPDLPTELQLGLLSVAIDALRDTVTDTIARHAEGN